MPYNMNWMWDSVRDAVTNTVQAIMDYTSETSVNTGTPYQVLEKAPAELPEVVINVLSIARQFQLDYDFGKAAPLLLRAATLAQAANVEPDFIVNTRERAATCLFKYLVQLARGEVQPVLLGDGTLVDMHVAYAKYYAVQNALVQNPIININPDRLRSDLQLMIKANCVMLENNLGYDEDHIANIAKWIGIGKFDPNHDENSFLFRDYRKLQRLIIQKGNTNTVKLR